MSIDKMLYRAPIIGNAYMRMHSYFREHVTVTDVVHVLVGLGIGLMLANSFYVFIGIAVLLLGTVYHVHAYIKGAGNKKV